jgi:predicted O-methyltransferase YrrM
MLEIINKISNLDIRECVSNGELEIIYNLLSSIAHNDMKCIEIGSWKGCSTSIIATIVRQYKNSKLYCIDHWMGNLNTGHIKEAENNVIYNIFLNNMKKLELLDVIEIIKSDSHTPANRFDNESIDFIFIDADHTYDFFKKDILLYWPKLKVNGIMCGHDSSVFYSKSNDNIKCIIDKNKNVNYVNSMHCGIVLSLYELFNDDYILHLGGNIWSKVKDESCLLIK